MLRKLCLAFLALVAVVPIASAGDLTVKFIEPERVKIPFFTELVVPGAWCAATGDAHAMVAVGHWVKTLDGHISLFKLDAQGNPGKPVVVKLPKPAGLAQRASYPLCLAFHPTLPLLYVWQDMTALKGDPIPPEDPAWKDFDHLLIYSIDGPTPELLVGLCRGSRFHIGALAGMICIDPVHGRFYVPNLRFGPKNPPEGASVGWLSMAGDGLPVPGDDEPAKAEEVDAPAKALAVRPARAAALRAALEAGKPVGAFRHIPEGTYGLNFVPTGLGFVPHSRDAFLVAGMLGVVSWDRTDRRAQSLNFLLPHFLAYYVMRITPHPVLPLFYATTAGYDSVFRVELADGLPTLMPQLAFLQGSALRTPPVIMARRNMVAWGGAGMVYMVATDAMGRFKEEGGLRVVVDNPTVDGLAYSEKFDRLFVAVEKVK